MPPTGQAMTRYRSAGLHGVAIDAAALLLLYRLGMTGRHHLWPIWR
jgi:hypothetical protein